MLGENEGTKADIIISVPDVPLRIEVLDILAREGRRSICAKSLPVLCQALAENPGAVLIVDLDGYSDGLRVALTDTEASASRLSVVSLVRKEELPRERDAAYGWACYSVDKRSLSTTLPLVLAKAYKHKLAYGPSIVIPTERGRTVTIKERGVSVGEDVKIFKERGTISRRTFLRATAAAAGVTAAAFAPGQPVMHALAATYKPGQEAEEGEQIFRSVCRANCFSYCALNVHVRDGKVVKTSQRAFPDERYNRICPKGMVHAQRLYGSTRVKYPMKRAGERGEDKWERISWEQAVAEIGEKLTAVRETYGNKAVAWYHGSGNCFSAINGEFPGSGPRFGNAIEATTVGICFDYAAMPGYARVYGPPSQIFGDNSEWSDIANAKSIFIWANNLTVGQPHHWHFIADALENGATLTVIDCNVTPIAAKADRHVVIRPGTDTALMMSMMQVIIEEKLQNTEFLLANTCAPYLVREDNLAYLRMSDLGVAPTEGAPDATGKATTIDPHVIWDTFTNKPVAEGSLLTAPALEGAFEANGIAVKTAFEMLKDRVADMTPETVAGITEIDAEIIRALAREMATNKPVSNLMGYGSQAYDNGPAVGHSLGTLAALCGNVGSPGNSIQHNWQFFMGFNWLFRLPDLLNVAAPTLPILMVPQLQKEGKVTIAGWDFVPLKAWWISQANPMSSSANQEYFHKEFIPSLDLIVVLEEQMTDSAKIADYVLPVSHYFEYDDVNIAGATSPYVQWGEKAIEPLYESKPEVEIYRLLANEIGIGKYFEKSNYDLIKEAIETPAGVAMGLTVDNIREKGAVRFMAEDYVAFADLKFGTPSGRMEFYCENPAPGAPEDRIAREHLPSWVPPKEAWPENPLHEKYPLVFMSERPRFRTHTTFFSTPWLRELDPEPVLKISAKDAADRGIKNGDYVEVFNDRGNAVAKAVVSQGIKPGVVSYPKGWQGYQFKDGNFSNMLLPDYDVVAVNHSLFDNLADIRKWNG